MDAQRHDYRSHYAAAIEAATVERRRRSERDAAVECRVQDQQARGHLLAAGMGDPQQSVGSGIDGYVRKVWEYVSRLTRWQWILIYALTACVYIGAGIGLVLLQVAAR